MGMLQVYYASGYSSKKEADAAADLKRAGVSWSSHACYGSLVRCDREKHTVTYSGCPTKIVSRECLQHYLKELQEFFPVTLTVFEQEDISAIEWFHSVFTPNKKDYTFVVVVSQIDSKQFSNLFGSNFADTLRLVYHTFLRAVHTYPYTLSKAWEKYQVDSSKSLMDWYMYYACTDTANPSDNEWKPMENQHGGHSFIHADKSRKKFPVSAQQFIFNFLVNNSHKSINTTFGNSCVVPFNAKSLY